ncbi:MAG: VCBS repeat-containing protein [Gammaproteobacteria bacterium]|nr:VCBS repeat-containing protein [Gammaproteobacteria bacterium]
MNSRLGCARAGLGAVLIALLASIATASESLLQPEDSDKDDRPQVNLPETDEELRRRLRSIVPEDAYPKVFESHDVVPSAGPLFDLGKQLFFSTSLSEQRDVACVSCHHPLLGGGDGLSMPVGVDAVDSGIIGPGRVHDGDRNKDRQADGGPNVPRNSPTTFNIQFYESVLFWDGRVEKIADAAAAGGGYQGLRTPDSLRSAPDPSAADMLAAAQAMFPITSFNEMFGRGKDGVLTNSEKRDLLLRRFTENPDANPWLPLFRAAFPEMAAAGVDSLVTLVNIGSALSAYQQSQRFIDNPWFRYLLGDDAAIGDNAKRGALLFYSDISAGGYACHSCHAGAKFSDERFYNIAMPQFGRGKDRNGFDLGRMLESSDPNDRYAFRTPSLLNVAVTGPWGHTGAYTSLLAVVRHHMDVETSVLGFDYSLQQLPQFIDAKTDLRRNTERSHEVLVDAMSAPEWGLLSHHKYRQRDAEDIAAFLRSLTDPCTLEPECLAPWIPRPEDAGPDGNALQVKFSSFDVQPVTWQPPLEDPRVPVTSSDSPTWFTNVTRDAGLDYELPAAGNGDEQHRVAGGVAVDDFDGDGWADLFVSHSVQPGKLFRNLGNGAFEDVTKAVLGELTSRQFGALFIDYDGDADKDLLLVEDNHLDGFLRAFENLGDGVMLPDPLKAGITFTRFTHSLAAGDVDNDEDLDLYAAHWGFTPGEKGVETFWRNTGDGMYADDSKVLPPTRISPVTGDVELTFTPIFTDIDADNDVDILVAGDFVTSQVLRNDGGHSFTDVTTAVISDENGMGAAVGDIDNDGDMDWFVTSIWNPVEQKGYVGGESGNRLYRNDGRGRFEDITDRAAVREGFWGWAACLADFNNDGWLDIFHTNGMTSKEVANEVLFAQFIHDPSLLYINNGDGTFAEQANEAGLLHTGQGRGVSCFDYDRDGDIDILVGHSGAPPSLFRNNLPETLNYISVQLRSPGQNADGIGAKVIVSTDTLTQTREIRLGSNYLSNDPPLAHFGLGDKARISKLTIVWPDGTTQHLSDIPSNQHLVINRQ